MGNFVYSINLILLLLAFSNPTFSQIFADMSAATGIDIPGQNRGVSVGDFNGDGLEDIYISRLSGKNLLFKNLGNFQFEEVGAQYGVNTSAETSCSLWFDMDNDGDQDLFLANFFTPNILYRNDGDTFTNVSGSYGINTVGNAKSLHAADYDNDGYLDVYITQFLEQNILWKNEGGRRFMDVTEAVGIDDDGKSLGAIFVDYDLDGDQDLYQTRDGQDPNLFFRNNGDGTFTEASEEVGLYLSSMGMGTDIADLNGDLYPDIYLTNLYENKLYMSKEGEVFEEVSTASGVDDIGMGWSTFFFDCNNDGQKDIYLANDSHFGVNGISPIPNRLFVNNGENYFYFEQNDGGEQNTMGSFGAATADFDRDGKMDIVVTNYGTQDGNQLFQNNSDSRSYISFDLKGTQSNADAIGARVIVYAEDKTWTDYVNAGSGYISQNSRRLHFGLANRTSVDSAVIHWPSGQRQKLEELSINTIHNITEGSFATNSNEVVWTEPAFPTQSDDVKVFFDASRGNAALKDFDGNVFAHTGVITSRSANDADWQHVIGNWGTFDSRVLMTKEGDDLYSISYNIQDFYGVLPGEEVRKMSFVFRDQSGNTVGRNADGSDIFTDVFPDTDSLFIALTSPEPGNIVEQGDSVLLNFRISKTASVLVLDNGTEILSDSTDLVEFFIQATEVGNHDVEIIAVAEGDTSRLNTSYFVISNIPAAEAPSDILDGLNYTDSSYIFQLHAPAKKYVFLLCPANDYSVDADFRMTPTSDGNRFWVEIPKTIFQEGQTTYQYLVDGYITIADPYAEVVLDPFHDAFVEARVMNELPEYPENATGIVTAFDVEKPSFDWLNDDFVDPAKTDLIIYELLLRDFLHDHSYQSLIDTLDYLEKLGVNAIELMPIQEFEGNNSWGYNPSFHSAVDKYYGSRDDLKRFIDEAHGHGMAVILDIVYNHTFSQGPLAQLYWDPINFRPSEDNPWLNVTPRHPFNVGYDFNHESQATRDWVKRGLERWISDYHFDGFRFDLSKGLTQKFSGNDIGLMGQYDASRIAILQDYADYIWSLDSNNYVILEHFGGDREERELANYGMMLWGNNNHEFGEAVMGYRSELRNNDYTAKNWNDPHLIAYMESHDEERIMYKVPIYGNSSSSTGYDTRNFETAIDRMKAATAVFYSIPGPKMLWQFGELGYDFSINRCDDGSYDPGCRLNDRPIRWDFVQDATRKELFDITAAMTHLKTQYPTFSTTDFEFRDDHIYQKIVHLNHPDMDATVIANFRTIQGGVIPRFQSTGTWYEYFSGDSIVVDNVNEMIIFGPGEYKIYTTKRIQPPGGFITTNINEFSQNTSFSIYPNPVELGQQLVIELTEYTKINASELISLHGGVIALTLRQEGENVHLDLPDNIARGMYILRMRSDKGVLTEKVLVK